MKETVATTLRIKISDETGCILSGFCRLDDLNRVKEENQKAISDETRYIRIISDEIEQIDSRKTFKAEITVAMKDGDGKVIDVRIYILDQVHVDSIHGKEAVCYVTAGSNGYVYEQKHS